MTLETPRVPRHEDHGAPCGEIVTAAVRARAGVLGVAVPLPSGATTRYAGIAHARERRGEAEETAAHAGGARATAAAAARAGDRAGADAPTAKGGARAGGARPAPARPHHGGAAPASGAPGEAPIAPLVGATAVSLAGLALGWAAQRWGVAAGWLSPAVPLAFFLASYAAGGYHRAVDGWRALRRGRVDINFLMLAAAVGAAALGQWQEGAALMFLFSLSNALEAFAMGRTRRAIRALMHLTPDVATVRREGREVEVRVEELKPGDVVLVKPAERIPVDGEVISGESAVNQAPITGESVPVDKGARDPVFAGTINGHGHLEIRVTRRAGDTTLARIIRIVQQAEEQKAKTERMTDWIDRYYTLFVIGLTLAVLLALPLGFGWRWADAFYRSMLVLVVASPCALVISTPAAILSAIASGARQGVLFKGGAHLEALGAVAAVAFDKTGTLTEGLPKVTDVIPLNGCSGEEVLRLAAAVERRSEHPLALAVVGAAEAGGVEAAAAEDVRALPGLGVEGLSEGRRVRLTRRPDPRRDGPDHQPLPDAVGAQVARLESQGKTVMLVWASAAGGGGAAGGDTIADGDPSATPALIGVIAAADTLRPEAKAAVTALRRLGVRRTVMLTGDNQPVAQRIAAQLGIDEVRAELLPDEKVAALRELRARHGSIAMVGDGVNDAPALASADVGVAMGGAGTDAALETADVVLMKDDLRKLPVALELGRRARRVVAQNLAFSGLVIAGLLIAAFTVDLTLPLGVVGHEGSTILVALNGLRLLRPAGRLVGLPPSPAPAG